VSTTDCSLRSSGCPFLVYPPPCRGTKTYSPPLVGTSPCSVMPPSVTLNCFFLSQPEWFAPVPCSTSGEFLRLSLCHPFLPLDSQRIRLCLRNPVSSLFLLLFVVEGEFSPCFLDGVFLFGPYWMAPVERHFLCFQPLRRDPFFSLRLIPPHGVPLASFFFLRSTTRLPFQVFSLLIFFY